MVGLLLLMGLMLLGLLVELALVLEAREAEAAERARIEREAQEASWRIHQRAASAFGEMLGAARDHQHGASER